MTRMLNKRILFFSLLIFSALSCADNVENDVQTAINKITNQIIVDNVQQSELADFYQVIAGTEVFYISKDMKYLFYGSFLNLDLDKKNRNITEKLRQKVRKQHLSSIKPPNTVVFSPIEQKVRTVIHVFTDLDCIFCRRFHNNIKEIVNAGVEVRYLPFPRGGVDSKSYEMSRFVWCSKDPYLAVEHVLSGKKLSVDKCENDLVKDGFDLGRRLGIKGTPTVIFEDGYMLSNYMEPNELIDKALQHMDN